MKKINKSEEPSSLTKFKRKNSSNKWEDIHTEQSQSIYEDCLLQCMDDQNYLCGYTEIKFEDNYHIDHFIKRDISPRQTFDWQNMIAAVHDSKFGADFKDKTVEKNDYNKRLKKYNHILNPVTDNIEGRFIFSTNGVIEPANRNDTYTGEDLYIFDREQTSYLALFDEAKAYVLNKDTSDSFKDFYAGSIGSTLIELAAGFSEFNSYSSIVARRESYLSEARLMDSSIGIAQTLGYSTFRGNNVKLSLTIIPTTTVTINKFDIIGTVGTYDIIALDDYDLQYGTDITITVVLGVLKVSAFTITDATPSLSSNLSKAPCAKETVDAIKNAITTTKFFIFLII
jgi:uncharacterized protein (TIGR02646 family)